MPAWPGSAESLAPAQTVSPAALSVMVVGPGLLILEMLVIHFSPSFKIERDTWA
jgi:hypothetical protein